MDRRALVWILLLLALSSGASAADPGHLASRISSGTFAAGDFVFPDQLSVSGDFLVDTGSLFVNATSGFVGINGSSPSDLLHIATGGSYGLRIDSSEDFPGIRLAVDGVDQAWLLAQGSTGALTLQGREEIVLVANSSNRLRIKGDGRIGIGTDSPTQLLDVRGSINTTGIVYAPEICLAGDCQTAWPGGDGWTDAGGVVRLNESGDNVSIGTSSSLARLHAYDGSGGSTMAGHFFATTLTDDFVDQVGSTRKTAVVTIGSGGSAPTRSLLNVYNDVDDGLLFVRMDGNVGIGTVAPSERLHVDGAVKLGTNTSTPSAGTIRWDGSNFEGYDGAQWLDLDVQAASGGGWTDEGAHVSLTAAGDSVGIGTSWVPNEKLEIYQGNIRLRNTNGPGQTAYVDFVPNSGSGSRIGSYRIAGGAGDGTDLRFYTANSSGTQIERLNIDQNGYLNLTTTGEAARIYGDAAGNFRIDPAGGKVGINTVAMPEEMLELYQGNIRLRNTNGPGQTAYIDFVPNSGSGSRIESYRIAGGSGDSTDLRFYTATDLGTRTERARIDSSGNLLLFSSGANASLSADAGGNIRLSPTGTGVGIGTSYNPNERLEIYQGNIRLKNNNGGDALTAYIDFVPNSGSGSRIESYRIGGGSGDGTDLRFYTATHAGVQTERMLIDKVGNVNITGALFVDGNTVWNAGNDGSGSGLDADTLDGVSSASFSQLGSTIDDTEMTAEDFGDFTCTGGEDGCTVDANSVALTTDTTGNYVASVSGGTGITISGSAGEGWTPSVAVTADSIGDTQLAFNTGQHLTSTSTPTFATISTGQGQYELFAMNQNVQTSNAVTFATVDTGQGANELYDMNQNVLTSSSPSFTGLTISGSTLTGSGSASTYGSISIDGSKSGYSGIHFPDVTGNGPTLMVHNTGDIQGFHHPSNGWSWYFDDGALTAGTVPWARLTGAPSVTGGTGLSGGGAISGSQTITLNTAAISTCTADNQRIVWDSGNSRLKCVTDAPAGQWGYLGSGISKVGCNCWWTVDFDTTHEGSGFLNTGTGRFTVPAGEGGVYLVIFRVASNVNTEVELLVNGVAAYTSSGWAAPVTTHVWLDAGDYIDVRIMEQNGGTFEITAGAQATFLQMVKVA